MIHSLQIDKVVCDCRVPRDLAGSEALRRALDEVAAEHLPRVLEEILEPLCPKNDESVWMIRRLEVKLSTDTSWDTAKITDHWAASVARSLFKTMEGDRDGHSVFHYRSRSEYLAAFITDLTEGTAWNKWQYEPLAGLRLLSSSAALRTLLITETDNTLAALTTLTSSSFRRAIAVLLSHDVERIWSHLVSEQLQPGRDALARVLKTWADDADGSLTCADRDALVVLLLALGGRNSSQLKDFRRQTTGAVQAVAALVALRSGTSFLEWPEIEASMLSGKLSKIARAGGSLSAWIAHPTLLPRAAEVLAFKTGANPGLTRAQTTAFGAAFLLLPAIEALPVDLWSSQAAAVRFEIFVRCCPRQVRDRVRHDAVLRELFKKGSHASEELKLIATPEDVWEWMRNNEHVAAEMPFDAGYLTEKDVIGVAAHAVLRGFAWKLPGFGRCSLQHLWANFLDFSAIMLVEPQRIVIRLGRPSLHVVLGLAGLNKGSYLLPRIDRRPFYLAEET